MGRASDKGSRTPAEDLKGPTNTGLLCREGCQRAPPCVSEDKTPFSRANGAGFPGKRRCLDISLDENDLRASNAVLGFSGLVSNEWTGMHDDYLRLIARFKSDDDHRCMIDPPRVAYSIKLKPLSLLTVARLWCALPNC